MKISLVFPLLDYSFNFSFYHSFVFVKLFDCGSFSSIVRSSVRCLPSFDRWLTANVCSLVYFQSCSRSFASMFMRLNDSKFFLFVCCLFLRLLIVSSFVDCFFVC